MEKKMDKMSKKKGNDVIKGWIQSIKCHMYWCVLSTTPGNLLFTFPCSIFVYV